MLPSRAPGIVGGALIAVARAAGEHRAAALHHRPPPGQVELEPPSRHQLCASLEIFTNARSLFAPAQDRAWAAAFTLILIVFVFTILARLVTAFFGRRTAT